MKTMKAHYDETDYEIDDYVDHRQERARKKKIHLVPDERRRPVRNWTKVWTDHSTDYDEVDDFYAKT